MVLNDLILKCFDQIVAVNLNLLLISLIIYILSKCFFLYLLSIQHCLRSIDFKRLGVLLWFLLPRRYRSNEWLQIAPIGLRLIPELYSVIVRLLLRLPFSLARTWLRMICGVLLWLQQIGLVWKLLIKVDKVNILFLLLVAFLKLLDPLFRDFEHRWPVDDLI